MQSKSPKTIKMAPEMENNPEASLVRNSVKDGSSFKELMSTQYIPNPSDQKAYDQLVREYKGTKRLFTDQAFPPTLDSLKFGTGESNKDLQYIVWKRISEFMPNAEFIKDKAEPGDAIQGGLGDCYFISAVSALAQQESRIKRLFPNLQVNPNGFYMAKLLYQGVPREVIVDDFIPIRRRVWSESIVEQKIYYCQPNGNQIWAMILEKCWAKLVGSYERASGGFPRNAFHALTYAPTFTYKLSSPSDRSFQALRANQKCWENICEADRMKDLICCGTGSIQSEGIYRRHAYTILTALTASNEKLLVLRNPWGRDQWRGRTSDKSNQFWNSLTWISRQRLLQANPSRNPNDGIFVMPFNDFLRFFDLVEVCKLRQNADYYYLRRERIPPDQKNRFRVTVRGGEFAILGLHRTPQVRDYTNDTWIKIVEVGGSTIKDEQYASSQFNNYFTQVPTDRYSKKTYIVEVRVRNLIEQTTQLTISAYSDGQCQVSAEGQFQNSIEKGQVLLSSQIKSIHDLSENNRLAASDTDCRRYKISSTRASEGQRLISSIAIKPANSVLLSNNSIYEQLLITHQNSSNKWTDPNFPPGKESINHVKNGSNVAKERLMKLISWKRIEEIIPDYIQFFKSDTQPVSLIQNNSPNCYFMSVLAALLEQKQTVKDLFVSLKINKNGIYMARLMDQGIVREVIVDDTVPVIPDVDQKGNYQYSLYYSEINGNQIWPLILQKCWAKVSGSYESIESSFPGQALQALSYAPTFTYYPKGLLQNCQQSSRQSEQFWKRLFETDLKHEIVLCSTGVRDSQKIHNFHAYTVIAVVQKPQRILLMNSCWGNAKKTGQVSDGQLRFLSSLDRKTKQKLRQLKSTFHTKEDTLFISYQDIAKYFISVDICKIRPSASNHSFRNNHVKNNQGYFYQLKVDGGKHLTLGVHRKKAQNNERVITRMVVARYNQGQSKSQYQYVAACSSPVLLNNYVQVQSYDLARGNYVVYVVCHWNQHEEISPITGFTLTAYTDAQVAFTESTVHKKDYFLARVFYGYALDRVVEKKSNISSALFDTCNSDREFTLKTGFAYSLVYNIREKMTLVFDLKKLSIEGLESTLSSTKKDRVVHQVSKPGQKYIIVFHTRDLDPHSKQFTVCSPEVEQSPSLKKALSASRFHHAH